MTSDRKDLIVFQCPACAKRLKAKPKAAGRRLQCPKCDAAISVPSVQNGTPVPKGEKPRDEEVSHPRKATQQPGADGNGRLKKATQAKLDDIFQLNTPAIADVSQRTQAASEIKVQKEKHREFVRRRNTTGKEAPGQLQPVAPKDGEGLERAPQPVLAASADSDGAIPFDSDHELLGPEESTPEQPAADTPAVPSEPSPPEPAARPSIFDDDLPELSQLDSPPVQDSSHEDEILAAHLNGATGGPDNDSLDDLIPDLGPTANLPALYDDEVNEEAQYRVICKTCGTPQYVSPSAQGLKIKCPDCYVQFKVPPPPKGWTPKGKPKQKVQLDEQDIPLAPSHEVPYAGSETARKDRAQEILERAKQEVSDEELERLYDHDFDTATFVQRTFGFLADPITLSQVLGYGLVFALLFAMAQFSAGNTDGFFGRGVLLLTVVLVPIVALLFALPMLSGGLALIEAVANKQRRVSEFPAFNMFDNAGDLILIALALAASLLPGYLVGAWLAGDGVGGLFVRVGGMMITSFLLFPIFLLSMLDNGSVFKPISGPVMSSLPTAAEAWGGYYLKTLVAFFVILVAWFVLLGKTPWMAAIAGFPLPLLVFFVCQQIGSLADTISDHLSFEFVPPKKDDEDEEEQTVVE